MKKINVLILLTATSLLLFNCSLFRNYAKITTKPEKYFSASISEPDTSFVSFSLNVDYKSIEEKVNSLFSEPISSSESGEFSEQYTAKTKNIAYDPVKWIKTKDPRYNPKKWLKTRIFGRKIKTRNPLYHPNKWIKTKNPKYDPNKWIYAKTVKVQVGYNYGYTVKKRQNIKFENVGTNTLRITIPLDISGSVGFKGEGAKLLSLTKKNIKTKVDVIVDTQISFDSNWCPIVKSNIDHKWVSDPKFEIAGGVWLNLKLPADIGLTFKEREIEKDISNKINCDQLTNELKKWIKPSSTKLTDLANPLYLNINPKNFYLSDLLVDDSNLNLKFASKLIIGVGTKKLYGSETRELPKLEKNSFKENLIALTVPLSVEYKSLEKELNDRLKSNPLSFEEKNTKIEILEFEAYPSGEELTIGVKIKAKLPNKILSTKGDIYLTAKPNIENKMFALENITFSIGLDNEIYALFGAIFKKKITRFIYTATKKDLSTDFVKVENIIKSGLEEQLKKNNNIQIETGKIIFDIPTIQINKEEFTIPLRLLSGAEITVKNVW